MKKSELDHLLQSGTVILDGSTGTALSARGMPAGASTELWALAHPEVLTALQREYALAGSRVLLAATFGCNAIKLSHYKDAPDTFSLNRDLVQLTRRAADKGCLVAADIAPTGEFLEPVGELSVDEMILAYKDQVLGAVAGGADFFFLETFMDIGEARAAILAIKEYSSLPFTLSMTFAANGRTITGADGASAAIIFEALGASAVGCNCSGGPDSLLGVVKAMREACSLPIIAKPNAGMPRTVDGKTVFDMTDAQFAEGMRELYAAGASVLGGCCGTQSAHIKALSAMSGLPIPAPRTSPLCLATERTHLRVGGPLVRLSCDIDTSSNASLRAALQKGDFDEALDIALDARDMGAQALDLHIDTVEPGKALNCLARELRSVALPLSFDSADADSLIYALRRYPGRALLNSVAPGKDARRLLEAAALYGAVPVLMCARPGQRLSAKERLDILDDLLSLAGEYGIAPSGVLADAALGTLASENDALVTAVKFIRGCNERSVATICGIRNISFGMPARAPLESAALRALEGAGLSAALVKCGEDLDLPLADDALTGEETAIIRYIDKYRGRP